MSKKILAALFISIVIAGTACAGTDGDQPGVETAKAVGAKPCGELATAECAKCGEPVPPETQPFEYKIGVNGFVRGEGVGSLNLSDFGYQPDHREGGLLYRVKPYAYWHPVDYIDIHLEGQGYGSMGGHDKSPDLSLYQGFAEARIPGKDWLSVKAGRQEFSYGSTFILGPDSFYNGLSFDAARVRLQPITGLSVDLLSGFYAAPSADGVKGNLSGAYASYAFSDGNALDAYGFRDTGSVDHHAGERLDSWGLRGTAKFEAITLELEPVYQSGEVLNPTTGGNDSISAYGGHADLSADATLGGLHHKFSIGYALGSGTKGAANGGSTAGEFRNPNNDTCIIGDMNVIGDLSGITVNDHHASGLQIITIGWGIDLTKNLTFSATSHYSSAGAVENGFSRSIGLETDFSMNYAINEDFSLLLAYDRFFTGAFFRDASGRSSDINYGYAMLSFNLDKTKPRKL